MALENANRRIEALENNNREPIAIIGMGCRFPGGATSPDRYWELLKEGRDAVTDIPPERWDADQFYDSDPDAAGKMSVRRAAFIENPDLFDAEFFGISPREAKSMDPQQRLLLEVTWEAFEDAGIPPTSLSGSKTGVFVGMCKCDYSNMHRSSGDEGRFGIYSTAGGAYSMASGRISYTLGLQGPSATIDTACSSSMVALHLACQSLLQDDCRMAVVGGVNLILSPENTISFSKADMMSPDGCCKTFDADANGFVQGEGCGVIVVKRLSDAVTDQDNILAVVRASAINQDGPSSGLTAPNGAAQQAVIRLALKHAGLLPDDIDYVEAHGTGTSLGDPIEIRALAAVLGAGHSKEKPLLVGSVKTNMGHLESAAGLASLIKVVLSLKHASIPPHLHFNTPSPHIEWDNIPIRIPTKLTPWKHNERQRLAGISSFGFSGTNVHVIVGEAPNKVAPEHASAIKPDIFTLSARNEQALDELIDSYRNFMAGPVVSDITQLCNLSSTGRSHFSARLAICAEDVTELRELLAGASDESLPAGVKRRSRKRSAEPRVAFLFTGQGSQYLGMGSALYADQPVFREAMDRCDSYLREKFDLPLLDILYSQDRASEDASERLRQTGIAQPAIFSLEYSLACLWMSWGVVPSAVVGHSVGEYVAACIAGIFDLEEALRLIAIRGRLMQGLPAGGKMVAALAPRDDIEKFIEDSSSDVVIAAVNGPRNTVVSGDSAEMDSLVSLLNDSGVDCQFLQVSHAFHSPLMQPMLGEFRKALAETKFKKLKLSLISNVSGQSAKSKELADPEYWLRHIEKPVLFADSMQTLKSRGCEIFVEIGPHPVLTTLGQTYLDDTNLSWIESMRRPVSLDQNTEWASLRASLAKFYVAGGNVDWKSVYSDTPVEFLSLPTYPFQRTRHWFDTNCALNTDASARAHPLLDSCIESPMHESLFQLQLSPGRIGFVDDHIVHGRCVLPATAYLEMASAVARERGFGSVDIIDLTLVEALVLPESNSIAVQVVVDNSESGWTFQVFSRSEDGVWKLHCEAQLVHTDRTIEGHSAPQFDTHAEKIDVDVYYQSLFDRGLHFGGRLLGISTLERSDGEAVANIAVPSDLIDELSDYEFHPAVLDACIQVIGAAVPGFRADDSGSDIFMPIAIERCVINPTNCCNLISCGQVIAEGEGGETMTGVVRVWDDTGSLVAHIDGIRMKRVSPSDLAADVSEDWLYQTLWREKSGAAQTRGSLTNIAVEKMIASMQESYVSLAEDCDLEEYFRGLSLLETISARFAHQALLELGWRPAIGDSVTAEELGSRIGVIPDHTRLLNRFLQILSQEGVMECRDETFIVKRVLERENPSDDLGQLLAEWPAGKAETELVARCGPSLALVLSGQIDPLDLLFPEGDTEAGAAIYTSSPLARVFNASVAEIVDATIRQIPDHQKLRVLEIGGGTGGTTRFILDRIDVQRVDYLFTDLGALFVTRAEEQFGEIESIRYQVLDIEHDPDEQALEGERFDLIIASNVIHATRDLDITFNNIQKMLAPSGLLVMSEVVARQNWIDTTFGMTEGWWHFSDTDRRPDYPLFDVPQWQSYLQERGFVATAELPSIGDIDRINAILVSVASDDRSAATAESLDRWVVFADQCGVADAFLHGRENRYADHVIQCKTAGSSDTGKDVVAGADHVDEYIQSLDPKSPPIGIVFFWPLDDSEASYSEARDGKSSSCEGLLRLVKGLANHNVALPGGLTLVTSGAQSTDFDNAAVNVFQAPIWGFAKVIVQEHPELNCRIVDLDPESPAECVGQLTALANDSAGESELAIRKGTILVPRLVQLSRLASFQGGENRMLQLGISKRGVLDNLAYQEKSVPLPGHDEVEIRVHTTGLNFRDVLNALGTYSGGDVPFGSECSGVIESVGEGVGEFSVGDRVIAIAEKSFADRVIAKTGLVIRKPENLSWARAACIPIAYVTAHYCLHAVGSVKEGERVLVHAGAGGVGMAAVQLALCAGAEVYATAGSSRKRQYLRDMGVTAALNSRSLDFAMELKSITGNGGIDIVINSLADEFIPASLSVLGSGGRFVEIGRTAIWTNEQVKAVRDDVEYHVVDLSSDMNVPTKQIKEIFRSVISFVEKGKLAGLPAKTFSRDQTKAAFRYMAQAKHIGKVAIEAPLSCESWVREQGSYLITGGFGGLGLLVANWLADRGASSLTLLGRSQPTTAAKTLIQAIREKGVDVEIVIADVSDESALGAVFESFGECRPLLRGILHCAGTLSDAPIVRQSWTGFESVFSAKVRGAWLLHQLSKDLELDCFVLFSSIASILGSPGQSNHCAANSFLDLLAHHRRGANLPVVNVNWGVWSAVGAAVDNDVEERASAKGLSLLAPQVGLDLLDLLMRSGRAQTMVQAIDWRKYRKAMGLSALTVPFLSELAQRRHGTHENSVREARTTSLRAELNALPIENRSQFLVALVQEEVAGVLGLDGTARLPGDLPLKEAGLDSLMAVELRNSLSKRIDIKLPATLMFDYPTIIAVSTFTEKLLFGDELIDSIEPHEKYEDDTDLDSMFASIESLSEEEADSLYQRKMQGK